MSEANSADAADTGAAALSAGALIVAYDGTNFAGYARQSDPPQRTVQEELERALATALHLPDATPLATVVAGRTDAGVHAAGQVVSFSGAGFAPTSFSRNAFLRSLNALTPTDISVRDLIFVSPDFSARFDAVSREYRYRIAGAPAPPLFLRPYVWHLPGFGADANRRAQMEQAAAILVGEHDFSSFAVTASLAGKNPVRRILSLDFCEAEYFGEPVIEIRIVGTAFLHSMVRTLVGTLVDLYAGRIKPGALPAILAARKRSAAGQTAPACGLTFHGVTYPCFSSCYS